MTLTEWQEKIDADFPSGLVVYYGSVQRGVPVACVTVVGVEGDGKYPLVVFWSLDGVKYYEDQLLSYGEVQTEPVKLVRVRGVEFGVMEWSANIGGELAAQARSQRDGERRWALQLAGVEE